MKRSTRLALFLIATFAVVAAAAWGSPSAQAADKVKHGATVVTEPKIADMCPSQPCVVNMLLGDMERMDPLTEIQAQKLSMFLEMAHLAGARAVLLIFMSPGGDFTAGQSIFNSIKSSPVPVDCLAGISASAAFWAFQACRTRYTLPEAMLMTHEVHYSAKGLAASDDDLSIADLQEKAEGLRKSTAVMGTDIAARMGITLEAYMARVHQGDWTMKGSEAVALHAADVVVKDYATARDAILKRVAATRSAPDAGAR